MINKQLLDVVNALFVVLIILGIVTDPTTPDYQIGKEINK